MLRPIIPTPVTPWPHLSRTAAATGSTRQARTITPFEGFRAAYPAFVHTLTADRTYREAQLERLGNLPPTGQRDQVRKMLRDRRLHKLYAYDAVRRAGRLRAATPETIAEFASRFNAFAPVNDELVTLRWVNKGSGRRWVHDFGPHRRMQQALVADILRHLHPPPRTQTLFNGGMRKAFEAIEAAYRAGMTYGVEVDIEDFYGCVGRERLAELLRPLPTSVVDHVVWDVTLHDDPSTMSVAGTVSDPTPSSPAGLSLGAATSPIVGERIISRLLAVAQLTETITYADNLFVLGRSEAEVSARLDTIRESAASAEVGPLGLREGFSIQYDLSLPFEYLKRQGCGSDDGFEWRPATSKLEQYMISASPRRLSEGEIAAAERRIRHWRRSYPDWRDGDYLEAEYLATLAARRYYGNQDAANLSAAVHAVVIAMQAYPEQQSAHYFVPEEGDTYLRPRDTLLAEVERWLQRAQDRRITVPS